MIFFKMIRCFCCHLIISQGGPNFETKFTALIGPVDIVNCFQGSGGYRVYYSIVSLPISIVLLAEPGRIYPNRCMISKWKMSCYFHHGWVGAWCEYMCTLCTSWYIFHAPQDCNSLVSMVLVCLCLATDMLKISIIHHVWQPYNTVFPNQLVFSHHHPQYSASWRWAGHRVSSCSHLWWKY